ncbi:MAG TPA: hypothetical protein VGB45_10815 [Abditibacterium sp.]|jgi:tetratricopeptide (TPR) repeat protein
MPRHLFNGLLGAFGALAFFILLRVVWSPDPSQSLFARAQRLEAAGQIPTALAHYRLISDTHPESFYAPRALLRQGDLLAARGRERGDKIALQTALGIYDRLASRYPSDPLTTEALLDAGQLAAQDLNDRVSAKRFYVLLLERSGAKSDAAATATVKLGRLAIADGDRLGAQTLLQRVLRSWPAFTERAAEAQFHLGVAYETLFKNKEWATRAYEATIARYPTSTWANDARGRLGLIVFSDTKGRRPARRVLIDIEALPDDGAADGSLWASLRPVLAARGLEADETMLRGLSLAPFYAGFDPKNPSRVVKSSFNAWENVLANAGLRFSIKSGGKEDEALRDLQDEIDAARAPLVYFGENGEGSWALVVGYDSERAEVMLQQRGARFDTLSAKKFATLWKVKSSFGEPFTLISFVARGTKAPVPSLTPKPTPSPLPNQTPIPEILTAPAFVWQLSPLSLSNTQTRAASRAATLLERPRNGGVLLGAAALASLAGELDRIARVAPETVTATPTAIPTPTPTSETPDGEPESPYLPEATPIPTPVPPAVKRKDAPRARALLGFFDAPAREWANSRREAAAWCDAAGDNLGNANFKRAAQSLRQSAEALEEASLLVPTDLSDPLGAGDRAQFGELARQIERARDAEVAATALLKSKAKR